MSHTSRIGCDIILLTSLIARLTSKIFFSKANIKAPLQVFKIFITDVVSWWYKKATLADWNAQCFALLNEYQQTNIAMPRAMPLAWSKNTCSRAYSIENN